MKVVSDSATPWTIQSLEFSRSWVHLFTKILEWVALPFSRGSSQPRDGTQVSCIADGFFTSWAEPQEEPKNTGVGSLSLLQGISPTQKSKWGLLHCRRILYQLSCQGSPRPHFSRDNLPVWIVYILSMLSYSSVDQEVQHEHYWVKIKVLMRLRFFLEALGENSCLAFSRFSRPPMFLVS